MPNDDEITKGDCHDCPWYEDCPRMRGLGVCYSDHQSSSTAALTEGPDRDPGYPRRGPRDGA